MSPSCHFIHSESSFGSVGSWCWTRRSLVLLAMVIVLTTRLLMTRTVPLLPLLVVIVGTTHSAVPNSNKDAPPRPHNTLPKLPVPLQFLRQEFVAPYGGETTGIKVLDLNRDGYSDVVYSAGRHSIDQSYVLFNYGPRTTPAVAAVASSFPISNPNKTLELELSHFQFSEPFPLGPKNGYFQLDAIQHPPHHRRSLVTAEETDDNNQNRTNHHHQQHQQHTSVLLVGGNCVRSEQEKVNTTLSLCPYDGYDTPTILLEVIVSTNCTARKNNSNNTNKNCTSTLDWHQVWQDPYPRQFIGGDSGDRNGAFLPDFTSSSSRSSSNIPDSGTLGRDIVPRPPTILVQGVDGMKFYEPIRRRRHKIRTTEESKRRRTPYSEYTYGTTPTYHVPTDGNLDTTPRRSTINRYTGLTHGFVTVAVATTNSTTTNMTKAATTMEFLQLPAVIAGPRTGSRLFPDQGYVQNIGVFHWEFLSFRCWLCLVSLSPTSCFSPKCFGLYFLAPLFYSQNPTTNLYYSPAAPLVMVVKDTRQKTTSTNGTTRSSRSRYHHFALFDGQSTRYAGNASLALQPTGVQLVDITGDGILDVLHTTFLYPKEIRTNFPLPQQYYLNLIVTLPPTAAGVAAAPISLSANSTVPARATLRTALRRSRTTRRRRTAAIPQQQNLSTFYNTNTNTYRNNIIQDDDGDGDVSTILPKTQEAIFDRLTSAGRSIATGNIYNTSPYNDVVIGTEGRKLTQQHHPPRNPNKKNTTNNTITAEASASSATSTTTTTIIPATLRLYANLGLDPNTKEFLGFQFVQELPIMADPNKTATTTTQSKHRHARTTTPTHPTPPVCSIRDIAIRSLLNNGPPYNKNNNSIGAAYNSESSSLTSSSSFQYTVSILTAIDCNEHAGNNKNSGSTTTTGNVMFHAIRSK